MIGDTIQPPKKISLNLGLLAVLLMFVYILSYTPFITESFLPKPVRIGIEGCLLLLLAVISLNRKYILASMFWFILIALVYFSMLFLEMHTFVKLVSSFNKLAFLILTIELLVRNQRALHACTKTWIQLSYFLCIMTLVAFIGYNGEIILFSPLDFGASVGGGQNSSYHYLHHGILGNITPRQLFGIDFGRVSGFMYEPGYLAFFLGFNILTARDWINDARTRKRFVWLNVIAGIVTLSTTFFLFFIFYFLAKKIKSKKRFKGSMTEVIVILTLAVFLIGFVLGSGYIGETSAGARLDRLGIYSSLVENNTWLTFLLGNGVGVSVEKFGLGIDSGWVSVFIERGVILFVILFVLFARLTKHNRWLMLYVLYCNFALNIFFTPLFLFLISISYACSFQKEGSAIRYRCRTNQLQDGKP